MRVFFDTNVWSYVSDEDAGDDVACIARRSGIQIAVSPAIVDEARAISNAAVRARRLTLITQQRWQRLMPEMFSECEEIKAEIRHLRPEWLLSIPDYTEARRLRYDWVRKKGGFWSRARTGVVPIATDESLRADNELRLARQQSHEIRRRIGTTSNSAAGTHLRLVAGNPDAGTPGWDGKAVEYWRVPALHFFRNELLVFASPYREWLDGEINVGAMLSNPASLNRLWLHDLRVEHMQRQWLRGAFEFLQAWHKVTDGTPTDSRLSTHLVECDVFISADKNFVRFAQRCYGEAPFSTAQGLRISAGRKGVDELLAFLATKPA